jgi:hypothetical protein
MINLKTGKTAPFDPKFMNTTYLPVIYDPKIEETQSLEENPISSFFRMIEWTKPNVLLLKEIIKSSPCPAITKFLYDIMTTNLQQKPNIRRRSNLETSQNCIFHVTKFLK